jgi:hypothetical protein
VVKIATIGLLNQVLFVVSDHVLLVDESTQLLQPEDSCHSTPQRASELHVPALDNRPIKYY